VPLLKMRICDTISAYPTMKTFDSQADSQCPVQNLKGAWPQF